MSRRPSKQRGRRYIQEYVQEKFPTRVVVFFNQAVGPPPSELFKAHPEIPLSHFRRWRFYVDAVVVTKEWLILIEEKLFQPAVGMGQLLFYRALLKDTPELRPYAKLPIKMILVTPRPDPRVIAFAGRIGIDVEVYSKPWVQAYLRKKGYA